MVNETQQNRAKADLSEIQSQIIALIDNGNQLAEANGLDFDVLESVLKETRNKILSRKLDTINLLIKEAMILADKYELTFDIGEDVGGYGTYTGKDAKGLYSDYEHHGWQRSDIC